ncbi:MAG TPA: NifU family protein [Solirubrobacterales bacterium]|nr:NifU family protein [Solirubrobacterales bacterium]
MAATAATDVAGGSAEELQQRLRELSDRVEAIEDPEARGAAQDLVAAVLEMHGAGLAKIGEVLDEAGAAGEEAKRKLLEDGVVASLLLIHDLYPISLEERVREALDEVRPYLDSHGGDVELLGVDDGVARLRLVGSCDGCPASASTLELAIKEALEKTAPDLIGLEVEGVIEAAPKPSGLELPVVQGNGAAPDGGAPNGNGAANRWLPLGASPPPEGTVAWTQVGGVEIALANVGGSLLAFRDRCAGCGAAISTGRLKGGVLDCPSCERRFYLPRAGRSMDAERLLLEPVPLLDSGGDVTVAVAA